MSTFDRIFGGAPTSTVPLWPAGLSSGDCHLYRNRYSPIRESWDYSSQAPHKVLPTRPISVQPPEWPGSKPSHRPIVATSNGSHEMQTQRQTNPLQPDYRIPASSGSRGGGGEALLSSTGSALKPSSQLSRSLDCSDISGARPRPTTVSPTRAARLYSSFDYSDVPGTRSRPHGLTPTTFATATGTVDGIPGASPKRQSHREVLGPGQGTLRCADIQGARPGTSRESDYMPSTWSLGRHPKPAVPTFRFNMQCRKTMIQRPELYYALEDKKY